MKHLIQQISRDFDWKIASTIIHWLIETAITIQQIPAPTFHEEQRAQHIAQQFKTLNLRQVHIDRQFNVYGLLPGANSNIPAIMITAHTDTVFPENTHLTIHYDDARIYGPGIGDNSIAVAALIGLARILAEAQIVPACNLWLVATTCEEGLGDLKGMKIAFKQLRSQIGSVINIEGLAFGHIYHAGIAVRRAHISAHAAGGHSWLHFGNPSAIHAILQLGAQITKIQLPRAPRTTYNIGMISGGQSINTISAEAELWLDLRSEKQEMLDRLHEQVINFTHELEGPELRFLVEIVGDRPAGEIELDHPLVQGAMQALLLSGMRGTLEKGSTDANIPLASGCPAITIGITKGGNAHRLDEYIEIQPVEAGLRQFITLTLATALHHSIAAKGES